MLWTLHTAIPDLRNIEWNKKTHFKEKTKSISMKYLLKKYDLEYKPSKIQPMIVYNEGNFYHHKKETQESTIYYINIKLVEDIVGKDKDAINGYVFELLAYGFFDKTARKSLKANNRVKPLFGPTKETSIHDYVAIKQYKQVFIHGA